MAGWWFELASLLHEESLKTLTGVLARVGAVRLPGWGPRDPPKGRLETIDDMAK